MPDHLSSARDRLGALQHLMGRIREGSPRTAYYDAARMAEALSVQLRQAARGSYVLAEIFPLDKRAGEGI